MLDIGYQYKTMRLRHLTYDLQLYTKALNATKDSIQIDGFATSKIEQIAYHTARRQEIIKAMYEYL